MASAASQPHSSADPGEELSAWLDGELDGPGAQALLDAGLGSAQSRQQFEAWCLVGDALRSHEVAAGHSPRLCARICAALENEPALLAPAALAAPRRPSHLARHVASGVAIAAAAAVVLLVAVPQLRNGGGAPAPQIVRNDAPPAAPALPARLAAHDSPYDPYEAAHEEYARGGLMQATVVELRSGGAPGR
jgi:sigma-E factor negative regulatory protein RseA